MINFELADARIHSKTSSIFLSPREAHHVSVDSLVPSLNLRLATAKKDLMQTGTMYPVETGFPLDQASWAGPDYGPPCWLVVGFADRFPRRRIDPRVSTCISRRRLSQFLLWVLEDKDKINLGKGPWQHVASATCRVDRVGGNRHANFIIQR